MTNQLNRTPEWARLKNAGILSVVDEPGRITVSRVSPGEQMLKTWQTLTWTVPVGLLVLGLVFGGIVGIFVALPTIIIWLCLTLFCRVLPGKERLDRFADRVVFTPEKLYFFRGQEMRYVLPREALQQIVCEKDDYGLRSHMFVADIGWMSAFPMSDATEQLLINNILMAAYRQPIHLDYEWPDYAAGPGPVLHDAPQVFASPPGAPGMATGTARGPQVLSFKPLTKP